MKDDIRVVDPTTVVWTEPVRELHVRTPFRTEDRRMALFRVDTESAWHRYDGALYGWVRAGDGRIAHGADGSATELTAGNFLRVPGGTATRYVAGSAPLEVLAVVDGGATVAPADSPSSGDPVSDPDVVGPDALVSALETPDLVRETPFPDAETTLLLRVQAAGGAVAGWHHHGENVYFGYAVDGPSETGYGPSGNRVERIEPGECFQIPPGLVHRDTNPTDETHTGIVWLCGGAPWVVNVDGPT